MITDQNIVYFIVGLITVFGLGFVTGWGFKEDE